MKKLTIQIRTAMQPQTILLILLSFGFIGLHAQDSIIPSGSIVNKLSSNQFQFLEGPVWYNDSVMLFVDDGLAGMSPDIYKYSPVTQKFSKWPAVAPHCTGLSCDKDGNLIGASSNILMINNAGQVIKTLASRYNGLPFINPNDLIADDHGGVYFSDPNFNSSAPTAIYYIDSIGIVTKVIDDIVKPNGLVLSPDGTKLYADETGNKYLYSWDVAPDGSVSGKIIVAELQFGSGSYADGMAIDIKGNIYVAGDKGIQVFSPQGTAITTITLPEHPSNCDFGGSDFKTLYITTLTNLYSIDLNYPGFAVSRKTGPNAINSIPSTALVAIFPNPVNDILYVQHIPGSVTIEILNMNGKMEPISYAKQKDSGIEINTQKLTSGMYLLRIESNDGILTRKFVKD